MVAIRMSSTPRIDQMMLQKVARSIRTSRPSSGTSQPTRTLIAVGSTPALRRARILRMREKPISISATARLMSSVKSSKM